MALHMGSQAHVLSYCHEAHMPRRFLAHWLKDPCSMLIS